MYEELDYKDYARMSIDKKILELKKWVEAQFAECRCTLRSIACIPDDDPDIRLVIQTPIKDLPKLINDYDDESIQHMLLKYRLDNNVVSCTEDLLDLNIVGAKAAEWCGECDGEDAAAVCHNRAVIDNLRTISKIFGFQSILEDLTIWRP